MCIHAHTSVLYANQISPPFSLAPFQYVSSFLLYNAAAAALNYRLTASVVDTTMAGVVDTARLQFFVGFLLITHMR